MSNATETADQYFTDISLSDDSRKGVDETRCEHLHPSWYVPVRGRHPDPIQTTGKLKWKEGRRADETQNKLPQRPERGDESQEPFTTPLEHKGPPYSCVLQWGLGNCLNSIGISPNPRLCDVSSLPTDTQFLTLNRICKICYP